MRLAPPSGTLVTGATGFLGRHLLERLSEAPSDPLRALARSAPPWLPSMGVEVVEGSITDPATAARAVRGVREIYHLAGLVSRRQDQQRLMYDLHVEGTRALLRAARAAGVRRVVLCSTSGTIAVTEDGATLPDETHPRPLPIIVRFPYYLSKAYQEDVAREECGREIELVTVQPSLVLGPGDDRLSSTGDVQAFLEGKVPVLPPGGLSFVDVRDVAAALVTAMKRARAGHRYLLGGANWTFERFFLRLARVAGRSAPRLRPGARLLNWAAGVADAAYRQLGQSPPFDRLAVEMSAYYWYLDCAKARAELGFEPRDPGQTLYDTVRYLRERAAKSA